MKKAFTILEISILSVILIIVACLVIPFSIDDTKQAAYILEWRALQDRINHAFTAAKVDGETDNIDIEKYIMQSISDGNYKAIQPYSIKYMNGRQASGIGNFETVYKVGEDNSLGFKWNNAQNSLSGIMFYDINGTQPPNRWGKDVFGINIDNGIVTPLCAGKSHSEIKEDCSKQGTGCCCSYYYLVGGKF